MSRTRPRALRAIVRRAMGVARLGGRSALAPVALLLEASVAERAPRRRIILAAAPREGGVLDRLIRRLQRSADRRGVRVNAQRAGRNGGCKKQRSLHDISPDTRSTTSAANANVRCKRSSCDYKTRLTYGAQRRAAVRSRTEATMFAVARRRRNRLAYRGSARPLRIKKIGTPHCSGRRRNYSNGNAAPCDAEHKARCRVRRFSATKKCRATPERRRRTDRLFQSL
jgi:hypothetical protein